MQDIIRTALERHELIAQRIAKKEADIAELREEAEKLDAFITLAQELFGSDETPAAVPGTEVRKEEQPAEMPPQPEAPRSMPVRPDRTA